MTTIKTMVIKGLKRFHKLKWHINWTLVGFLPLGKNTNFTDSVSRDIKVQQHTIGSSSGPRQRSREDFGTNHLPLMKT